MKTVLLIALLVPLAGCLGDSGSEDTVTAPPAVPDAGRESGVREADTASTVEPREPEVHEFDGQAALMANTMVVGAGQMNLYNDYTVARGATAILVEAQWSCATGACPADVVTQRETSTEHGASGADAARLVIDAPRDGQWTVWLQAQPFEPYLMMDWQVRVTVFFDGSVPDDYTGFA